MGKFRIVRQLLAAFVVAGLALAPMGAPVAAAAMQADPMVGMADDMPCCPPSPQPNDCQKCPLIGLCVAKTFQGMPTEAIIAHPAWSLSRTGLPRNDGARDSLGDPPLPRPPRSLGLPA